MTTQQHSYELEIYTVLSGLGWSSNPLAYPERYGDLRNQNDDALVFRPIKSKFHRQGVPRRRFKLGVDHSDCVGMDKIPFREFNLDAPRWVQSVYAWHASTTFKLAEIRAKHAERDDKIRRSRQRQQDSWKELCAGSEAMNNFAVPYSYDDDDNVASIRVVWSHSPYSNPKPLANMTMTEKADKVRRLCEFLQREGWQD